jgi:hypothetical protein
MGVLIAALCGLGLWQARWFLENTPKGRLLASWLGPQRGLLWLRVFLVAGMGFGVLLAADVVRPIQWSKP